MEKAPAKTTVDGANEGLKGVFYGCFGHGGGINNRPENSGSPNLALSPLLEKAIMSLRRQRAQGSKRLIMEV